MARKYTPMPISTRHKQKRSTNVAIALSLVALALLFFLVSLVKLGGA